MKKILLFLLVCLVVSATTFPVYGAKPVSSNAIEKLPLQQQYIKSLEPWIKAAMTEIRFVSDDMATYGMGQHGHWYMQAHDTAFCAFAVLATDPSTDEKAVGMSKAELRRIAMAMLRYTLRTHLVGGSVCTDGKPWGNTWISNLGLERMTAGIESLWDELDDELRQLYAKVCASEADYLLKEKIVAETVGRNCPESNMWKGAVCWRAAALNPKSENVDQWREKASCFFINSMSVPSDKKNDKVLDGKPVKERFVGANMFESRACDHHGYQNVGYMNITESNLALLHFWCKKHGYPTPQSLYHNALPQWKLMKACTFDDGRLLRVGGDTRVRYCYCQDYALFVWLFAHDYFGDADTVAFERGWLRQVQKEHDDNPTGWFMYNRLKNMYDMSPLYFTRLEGDKACTLATAAWLRRQFDIDATPKKKVDAPKTWYSGEHHGAWFQLGQKRIASWAWDGATKASGICLPRDKSDLAEWASNLAGLVHGVGTKNIAKPVQWTGYQFKGGFATCGLSQLISSGVLAEGDHDPEVGTLFQAFIALPDDETCVTLQRSRTIKSNYLRRVRGLYLLIPNDVFNDFSRKVYTSKGTETLTGIPNNYTIVENSGNWLNIDDRLGVVEIYGGTPKVNRIPDRNRGLAFLYSEEIAQVCSDGPLYVGKNSDIFDCAAAVKVASAKSTEQYAKNKTVRKINCNDDDLRAVEVCGADNVRYYIVANFSNKKKSLDTSLLSQWFDGAKVQPLHQFGTSFEPFAVGIWFAKQK